MTVPDDLFRQAGERHLVVGMESTQKGPQAVSPTRRAPHLCRIVLLDLDGRERYAEHIPGRGAIESAASALITRLRKETS